MPLASRDLQRNSEAILDDLSVDGNDLAKAEFLLEQAREDG